MSEQWVTMSNERWLELRKLASTEMRDALLEAECQRALVKKANVMSGRWEEEARRYCQNEEYHREKRHKAEKRAEKLEVLVRDMIAGMLIGKTSVRQVNIWTDELEKL